MTFLRNFLQMQQNISQDKSNYNNIILNDGLFDAVIISRFY